MTDRGRGINPTSSPEGAHPRVEPPVTGASATTGEGPTAAAPPDPTLLEDFAATPKPAPRISTAYRPPDRWEDEDYDRHGQFKEARPVWEIDGKVFAGPLLVPEVMKPNGLKEEKQARATLETLFHRATLVASGAHPVQYSHYYGVDDRGRHRVT